MGNLVCLSRKTTTQSQITLRDLTGLTAPRHLSYKDISDPAQTRSPRRTAVEVNQRSRPFRDVRLPAVAHTKRYSP